MFLIKKFILLFLTFAIINGALSQDANKRNSLLSKRPNQFQRQSTTTTTPEPVEYEDEYDEEEQVEEEVKETTTTTTEVPRKRPIVRPFRSNEDLLAALKKRRQNEKNKPVNNAKPVQEEKFKPSEVKTTKATTAAPSNVNGNSKRRFSGSKSSYAKPIIQDQQAQNIEEQPAPRTSSFRRPSRFALRNN